MSKEVKRYFVDCNWLRGVNEPIDDCDVRVVLASDYDALLEENKRLESAWKVDVLNRKDELIAKQEKENDRVKAERDALLAERDALKKDADKFRHVERAMEALGCDEREGGIVTAASLVLISSAHRMNAKRGVIDQEGVTFDDGQIGDWRVTIERIDAALQGAQP